MNEDEIEDLCDKISLEYVCKICNGRGLFFDKRLQKTVPCHTCEQSGYETTLLGEKVLNLLKHNFVRLYFDNKLDEGK